MNFVISIRRPEVVLKPVNSQSNDSTDLKEVNAVKIMSAVSVWVARICCSAISVGLPNNERHKSVTMKRRGEEADEENMPYE